MRNTTGSGAETLAKQLPTDIQNNILTTTLGIMEQENSNLRRDLYREREAHNKMREAHIEAKTRVTNLRNSHRVLSSRLDAISEISSSGFPFPHDKLSRINAIAGGRAPP